jgi:hypothetical protein
MSIQTANSSLLLSGSKIYEILQFYYSPSATAYQNSSEVNYNLYAFIGKTTPWEDNQNPPVPTQDQYSIKKVFKDIIAVKKIITSDVSPVIPRRDWTSGVVYDYYDDHEDMFAVDSQYLISKNFYVRNKFDQIFKCLWNNNGAPSTDQPQFLPGTFDSTFLIQTTDGYKWKFMYTINGGIKQKFLDENWMPCSVGTIIPSPAVSAAGAGSIDVINVTTVGVGYDPTGVTINIVGDGTGASASAVVNAAGYLTDVTMITTGTNYTYAEVTIDVNNGFNTPNVASVAIAPVSPPGGHSIDPISELGCNNVMISLDFTGDEGGTIPTDLTYYQLGMILNPQATSELPDLATDERYDVTSQLFVSPGSGSYVSGQTVYQGTSLAAATFTATVANFNSSTNVVKVINTEGSIIDNEPLFQDSNGAINSAVRTVLSHSESDFIKMSGYMTYIENRSAITRSSDGTEQFRVVFRF